MTSNGKCPRDHQEVLVRYRTRALKNFYVEPKWYECVSIASFVLTYPADLKTVTVPGFGGYFVIPDLILSNHNREHAIIDWVGFPYLTDSEIRSVQFDELRKRKADALRSAKLKLTREEIEALGLVEEDFCG